MWGLSQNLVDYPLRILKLRRLVIDEVERRGLDHLGFFGEWDSRRVACGLVSVSDRMV